MRQLLAGPRCQSTWRRWWLYQPYPSPLSPSVPPTLTRSIASSSTQQQPQSPASSNSQGGASSPSLDPPSTLSPPSSSSPSDDPVDASPSSPPLTVAQRCDPYEQQGKPLTPERVHQLLPTLDPGWSYDPSTRTLTKTFSFRPPPTPSLVHPPHPSLSPFPPPSTPLSTLFSFLSHVGHLCLNDGHSPYHLSLHPRRLSATVDLRTPPLQGLSYRDLALAMKLDGLHRTLTSHTLRSG